jgi:O-antigen ligase
MRKIFPYLLSIFVVFDFILAGVLGWFGNFPLSFLYLGVIFTLFIFNPCWGIIILIASQVLDTISIFEIRLYQWAAVFLILALIIKAFSAWEKSLKALLTFFKKNYFFTVCLLLLILASLLGLLNSNIFYYSLKQTIVLVSLISISFLVFWWAKKKKRGRKQVILAFIFSSIPVSLFSIYQNIAHEKGWESFTTMAARPNAFFYEPDWLGMYLALVLVLLITQAVKEKDKKSNFGIWLLVLLNVITLIISVARASWLAAIAGGLIFIGWGILAFLLKKIKRKEFLKVLVVFTNYLITFVVALILIGSFKLTRFDLKDRFQSIYKGEHIITIAQRDDPYEKVKINLEEIKNYEQKGYQIYEEKVSDENIESRFESYSSNWEMVKEHWLLGQGQGATLIKRNFIHNANNIFYEWWIAGGVLGLISFVFLLGGILKGPFFNYWRVQNPSFNFFLNQAILLGGISGIIITNLFNSGIFFAPLWIFLGIAYSLRDQKK